MSSPELDTLRAQLDTADALLVRALCLRASVVADVARAKASAGLPAHDPAREASQLARAEELALAHGVAPEGVALVREVLSIALERCRAEVARRMDAPA